MKNTASGNSRSKVKHLRRARLTTDCVISCELPALPDLEYYDDYNDQTYTVPDTQNDRWPLHFDGQTTELAFDEFGISLRPLIKHWCASLLCSGLAPASVTIYFAGLLKVDDARLAELVRTDPPEMGSLWRLLRSEYPNVKTMMSVKSLLRFLCLHNLGEWNRDLLVTVAQLPLPQVDKYAAIRAGEVFLDIEERSTLARVIDDFSQLVQEAPQKVTTSRLEDIALLICFHLFGLRPKQVGLLKMCDVRIWRDDADGFLSIHLNFMMIKQRSASRRLPLPRRVKHAWAPIFEELIKRRKLANTLGNASFFAFQSADQIGARIRNITKTILGHSRSATEFRHTAAQLRVDAGSSAEQLAAFMGHSDLETGKVYYRESPTQAELINRAQRLSRTSRKMLKIAHGDFVSVEELIQLPGDRQIGGAPYGVAISGIGGCSSGQPSCRLNPVMACYGCPKFMPVRDVKVHRLVLETARAIVLMFFKTESQDGSRSPAYLQLEQTIAYIDALTHELEESES